MTVIEKALEARHLPTAVGADEHFTKEEWAVRRGELLTLLSRELFGFTPEKWRHLPMRVEPDAEMPIDRVHTCAGKIQTRLYRMIFTFVDGAEYAVPFVLHLPLGIEKPPVILHLAFRRAYPDRYLPVEEITDRGYALIHFCYEDATPDRMHSTYSDGLAAYLVETPRKPDEWGNIGVWAYTATRLMDWITEQPRLDGDCVSVCGHSRLGKTALWCGAQDERFFCTYGNCTGYGGGSLIRGKTGESITDFVKYGSWCWFSETFKDYEDRPAEELPYDMHFLLSCIAPRYLYIGAAELDTCVDYNSGFLAAAAASNAWTALGKTGLAAPDKLPVPGETVLLDGSIGFHVRHYDHYLSREDWVHFLDFLDRKRA